MANSSQQISDYFSKAKASGLSLDDAYAKAKSAFAAQGKSDFLPELEGQYNMAKSGTTYGPGKDGGIVKPTTPKDGGIVTPKKPSDVFSKGTSNTKNKSLTGGVIPESYEDMGSAPTPATGGVIPESYENMGPVTAPVSDGDPNGDPVITKYVSTFNDVINSNPGKTKEELRKAIEDRMKASKISDRNRKAMEDAINKVFGGSTASSGADKSDESNNEFLDTKASDMETGNSDFESKMQKQLDAIRKEYDEKMKIQQEYTNNIKSLYDKNRAEFDAKYANIRDSISKMENSADSTRNELMNFTKGQFEEGMKRVALEQAGRHAAVSGRLTGQAGVSDELISNALQEAANDPSTIAAVEQLKDKQVKNLTDLQTNYGNWYNQIIGQKTTLTNNESELAEAVLAKKAEIDKEIRDLKTSGTTALMKPMQDYYAASTAQGQTNQLKEEQADVELKRYAEASPDNKKDILWKKLYDSTGGGADRNLITPAMMDQAIKMGSLPDAIIYLTSQIHDRGIAEKLKQTAAQLGGSSGGGSSSGGSTGSSGSSSPSSNAVSKTGTSKQPANSSTDKQLEKSDIDMFNALETREKQLKVIQNFKDKGLIKQAEQLEKLLKPEVGSSNATGKTAKDIIDFSINEQSKGGGTIKGNKVTFPNGTWKEFSVINGKPQYRYFDGKKTSEWTNVGNKPTFLEKSNLETDMLSGGTNFTNRSVNDLGKPIKITSDILKIAYDIAKKINPNIVSSALDGAVNKAKNKLSTFSSPKALTQFIVDQLTKR